ncbi:MAG: cytochrome c oxidase subunit II [Daejeonella sp.]
MRLRNYLIKLIFTVIVICTSLINIKTSFAQVQAKDTASAATAVDTASAVKETANTASSSGISSASEPLISTAVDTTAFSQAEQAKPEVDRSPLYKSASYYLLLFFLGCIFIGIIGKILRVYELSREMQGRKSRFDWRRLQGVLFAIALIAGMYGVYWSYTVQGSMGIHESATVHGERIDFMFNITLIITTIVFILTHILLFGFSFKYRGSEKKKAYYYPHNNAVERLWTIVPAIVLTVLVLLGFFTWRSITNVSEADQKKALNIEVIGQQFKWNLRYAGADNQFGLRNYKLITATNAMGIDFKDSKSWDDKFTDTLMIPVNRPVRVNIGSKDVLHSFYIPDFRVQMNAVPGMVTNFQFTPRFTTEEMREKRNNPSYNYILLCAKICGSAHYNMQKVVLVVTEKEYAEWIAKQKLFYNDDVKKEMQTAEQKKTVQQNNIVLNTKLKK